MKICLFIFCGVLNWLLGLLIVFVLIEVGSLVFLKLLFNSISNLYFTPKFVDTLSVHVDSKMLINGA